jgi:hypothetical protein
VLDGSDAEMSKATKVVWAENWESLEKLGVRKEQRWKWEAALHLSPRGRTRFPQLAPTGLKNHVQTCRIEVIPNFHDIFVVLQCLSKHPLSLQ